MQTIPLNKAKPVRYTRVPSLRPRVSASPPQVPVSTAPPMQRVTGRALQRIRRQHLQQQPLCVRCKSKGRIAAATQIDHEIPLWNGGADTDSNRQGLCDDCHREKTASECSLRAAMR
jgi:5-methylcytosine-specific restriction protein A